MKGTYIAMIGLVFSILHAGSFECASPKTRIIPCKERRGSHGKRGPSGYQGLPGVPGIVGTPGTAGTNVDLDLSPMISCIITGPDSTATVQGFPFPSNCIFPFNTTIASKGGITNSSGTFTVPAAGIYKVNFGAVYKSDDPPAQVQVALLVDGNSVYLANASQNEWFEASVMARVNSTIQVVNISVFAITTGRPLTLLNTFDSPDSTSAYITIKRIA